ncbi:magnesium-translocating P-type ATPase [Achromobacter marplatensis]|jgi:Mg2+-importing ATPase|uniref:Magnesium-transporting ATPase, P-type 1 n=1 Tax=Achromobacter marplatensis TaxID=470868 RepID=A0AA43AZB7_9BURK|nr:magnesium-translocating P-type ATPase [Achromobacter marplatensis]MDH2052056.1 magnesium-translocating P-type ATPase [Achromobacter marplatensis]
MQDPNDGPFWWEQDDNTFLTRLRCTSAGLSAEAAALRQEPPQPPLSRLAALRLGVLALLHRFANPLVLILLIAGAISAFVGEIANFVIIGGIILISVLLDAYQEARSAGAAQRLQQSLAHWATVVRDGQPTRIAAAQVVPGDLLQLHAGDIVPADARLLTAQHLQINQALLTGESFPVEKRPGVSSDPVHAAIDTPNAVFAGSAVHSGNATAIAVLTGSHTELGQIGANIAKREKPTAFDMDIQGFGMFIMRLTLFLVLFVLLINALFHRPWLESFMFAVALAVGLTPELLPMIVSVTLARGAMRLAQKHVIVKQLPVIQNLGTMDVFCCDKTGTLTEAEIRLDRTIDLEGIASAPVAALLFVNSYFASGVKSALDEAVLSIKGATSNGWTLLGQLPFDFDRRRAAVLVQGTAGQLLIVKGAPDDVLRVCDQYTPKEGSPPQPLDTPARQRVSQTFRDLEQEGFRILAVASRSMQDARSAIDINDESGLVLHGYAAFMDPPKHGAAAALKSLRSSGVQIKIISGDSELVTQHLCAKLHLPVKGVLTGSELSLMDAAALRSKVERTTLFCRMTPSQKERVVLACKHLGHTVGYLGDGINDAPALHAADVGMAVDSAADVARDAARVILLRRSLSVVHDGVMEGRRTSMNVFKYIMMGTSSNFGNMFSMAGAALFLPFLPMLPVQILLNNMLYDISELPIPLDNVDASDMAAPRRLDIASIRKFMLIVGPASSAFDFITFYLLLHVLDANEATFQTCWFVESLCTQVLVIFVIRTSGNPFKSRPNAILVAASCLVVAVALWLPVSPLADFFSFTPPPAAFYLILAPLIISYLVVVQAIKLRFFSAVPPR